MQKFTQKWALISLLEPVAGGIEFFWKDPPLHVTLAGVFAADWERTKLFEKLSALLVNQQPVRVEAEYETYWGAHKEYHVMTLQKTPEMMTLHNDIHDVLKNSRAVFNEPHFEGDEFIPHSTIQRHARLHKGDAVKIDGLTVVDMFPHGDGYQRKILRTIKFLER